MRAEIFLEARIGSDVRLVVSEQVKLNLVIAGTIEEMLVERVALRCDMRDIGLAVLVLEPRGPCRQEAA